MRSQRTETGSPSFLCPFFAPVLAPNLAPAPAPVPLFVVSVSVLFANGRVSAVATPIDESGWDQNDLNQTDQPETVSESCRGSPAVAPVV